MTELTIEAGKSYKNNRGDVVKISHKLPDRSPFRKDGYEFVSTDDTTGPSIYRPDGTVDMVDHNDSYNLVEEIIPSTPLSPTEIREDGYYWLKLLGKWTIGEWNKSFREWTSVIGLEEATYHDEFFDEIDERRIERT